MAWLRATLLSIRPVDSHHPSPLTPSFPPFFHAAEFSGLDDLARKTSWSIQQSHRSNPLFFLFFFSSFFRGNVRERSTSRLSRDLVRDFQFASASQETVMVWHTNIFNLLLVKLINGKSIFSPHKRWQVFLSNFSPFRGLLWCLLSHKDTIACPSTQIFCA